MSTGTPISILPPRQTVIDLQRGAAGLYSNNLLPLRQLAITTGAARIIWDARSVKSLNRSTEFFDRLPVLRLFVLHAAGGRVNFGINGECDGSAATMVNTNVQLVNIATSGNLVASSFDFAPFAPIWITARAITTDAIINVTIAYPNAL
jgi:hypothetical protein